MPRGDAGGCRVWRVEGGGERSEAEPRMLGDKSRLGRSAESRLVREMRKPAAAATGERMNE
jgi:hypothetical protein